MSSPSTVIARSTYGSGHGLSAATLFGHWAIAPNTLPELLRQFGGFPENDLEAGPVGTPALNRQRADRHRVALQRGQRRPAGTRVARSSRPTDLALIGLLAVMEVPIAAITVGLLLKRPDGWVLEAGLGAVVALGLLVLIGYLFLTPVEDATGPVD